MGKDEDLSKPLVLTKSINVTKQEDKITPVTIPVLQGRMNYVVASE